MARVSPVTSTQPWAFLAIRGHKQGAPRWLLLEGASAVPITDLADIADRLRHHLQPDPPSLGFDAASVQTQGRSQETNLRPESLDDLSWA